MGAHTIVTNIYIDVGIDIDIDVLDTDTASAFGVCQASPKYWPTHPDPASNEAAGKCAPPPPNLPG